MEGTTNLHRAVAHGNIEEIKNLLSQRVDVNAKETGSGMTPVHIAVSKLQEDTVPEVLAILLSAGPDLNLKDNCHLTAIQYAIRRMYDNRLSFDSVKLLIDAEANVNSLDLLGRGLLRLAAIRNNVPMIEYLLSHGADVNIKDKICGNTPLHWGNQDKKTIKCLLKNNADVNAKNSEGCTPLLSAVFIYGNKRHRLDDKLFDFRETEVNSLVTMLEYSDVNKTDARERNILFYELPANVWKTILAHLAKLKVLDIAVDSSITTIIFDRIDYNTYFTKCVQELTKAKNMKLHNSSVTFFNLLIDSKRKVRNYVGNEELVKDFVKSDCLNKFPIYGATMQKNIVKGIKKRALFDISVIHLSNFLPIFRPTYSIMRDFIDCLEEEDLKNWCEL